MGRSGQASFGYGALCSLRKAALAFAITLTPAAAQEVTILAMGDSLTAGFGLPQSDGFVPQLQTWLQARGHDVAILNAGVSGDTTGGGLARIDWALSPEVDAMILALGGNDLLRGLPPAQAQDNLDGILTAVGDRPALVVGLEAPLNYGADYKAQFEAIFPALAAAHEALLFPDFLAGIRQAAEDGASLGSLMQADGIHPTAEGVGHVVEAIGPMVETLIARVE